MKEKNVPSPSPGSYGIYAYNLLRDMFKITRSITGDGVRQTYDILKQHIPLEVHEVPTGTKVLDWEVPKEWNIREAYIEGPDGRRIIDMADSNLHVVGYSVPVDKTMTYEELLPHLHTLPQTPDLIPYITSYYNPTWGLCLTDNQLKSMDPNASYHVKIDSTLDDGSLSYGEVYIPGETDEEILLSCYTCHPSMANDSLSGVVVATTLVRELLQRKNRYSYRVLFIPETIGSITYLHYHMDELKAEVIAGYVITCIGDQGLFSYLSSRYADQLVDQLTTHVLRHSVGEFLQYSFLDRGSDERQFCAPGIDLPVGSLMRSKHREFKEYHTSADNLDFVTAEALEESIVVYMRCLDALEKNRTYQIDVLGEPQLGRRGLYPTLSTVDSLNQVITQRNFLAYCDGTNTLLEIADLIGEPIWKLYEIADLFVDHDLIHSVD